MITWIKTLFLNRYLKSIVRYLIVAFVVYLNKDLDLPYLKELADFLHEHHEKLIDLISAALIGWVGTWSVLKNANNSKVEKQIHKEVK